VNVPRLFMAKHTPHRLEKYGFISKGERPEES
jgi:hypothetical protein